jgi:hypothetical protein
LEAASIPAVAAPLESAPSFAPASAGGLVTASLAFTNRLALGVAAGLIAVLVHGEATRLATEELTWRALLGR